MSQWQLRTCASNEEADRAKDKKQKMLAEYTSLSNKHSVSLSTLACMQSREAQEKREEKQKQEGQKKKGKEEEKGKGKQGNCDRCIAHLCMCVA